MFNNGEIFKNLIREYADRIKNSDNKSIETELMYLLYECELERIKLKKNNFKYFLKTS